MVSKKGTPRKSTASVFPQHAVKGISEYRPLYVVVVTRVSTDGYLTMGSDVMGGYYVEEDALARMTTVFEDECRKMRSVEYYQAVDTHWTEVLEIRSKMLAVFDPDGNREAVSVKVLCVKECDIHSD